MPNRLVVNFFSHTFHHHWGRKSKSTMGVKMFQTIQAEATGPIEMPMQKPIRALLLDDNNFDRARIRRLSNKTDLGIQLDEVGSIEELDSAVRQASYDLIMIDYRLPVGDGMTALSHILDDPMNCDAGKIMITGDAAVDTAVQAMRGGCHDFLAKESMNADVLRDAMLNAIAVARERLNFQIQAQHQREMIRQGLVEALNDTEVQGTVLSLVRQQMAFTPMDKSKLREVTNIGDIDELVAGLGDEDEFVFH
jgi:CheY-like chemotaxis protein